MTADNCPQPREYFLRPGYIYVPRAPSLISTVLGSCVAVCIWDTELRYGGMNHFLYPCVRDPSRTTAQFGNVATQALIRLLLEEGSRPEALEAQIFGGAAPANGSDQASRIARENVAVARRTLESKGIRIASEDVGGAKGRKLVYNSSTNEVVVFRVDALRQGDWYPYEGQR